MRWTFTAVAYLTVVCGCADANGGSVPASGEPREGGTLVIAAPSDLQAFNPLVNTDAYTGELINNALFMTLVRFDESLEYEPWLASGWTWTGDTAVTMWLRPEVRWSDGRAVTAHDVAFTLERARDPATAYPRPDLVADWLVAEVVDSLTVRFLVRPHADPLTTWTELAIVPAHVLDTVPAERMRTAAFNRQPVTSGPFRLAGGTPNQQWVLEANPDFPAPLGGRPYLDRVVWRVIPENAAQVTELETGRADLILSPRAEQLATLDARPGLRAIVKPSRRYIFVGWNGAHAPLDDARVRRALTLATDRQTMLKGLRAGYGTLAFGPIAPHHWAYDEELAPLPFDAGAARALLDSAAVRDRDGDGLRERPDGTLWQLELSIPANNAFNRDIAQKLQSDLAAVGVRVRIRQIDFATLIDDVSSPERRFDGVIMGWEADLRPALRDLFHSESIGGPFQLASYSNPAVDSLLDRLDGTTDRTTARDLWAAVQARLREDQPWMFLWYAPDLHVIRDNVRGVSMDVRGAFTNLADWWLGDAAVAPRTASAGGGQDGRPLP